MEKNKDLSVAVLYTNGIKFLSVHPTNHQGDYWDIPKGINEDGEQYTETAIREFEEETSIKLNKNNLKYIGKYYLHKNKDIILFLYLTNKLEDISNLKCKSLTYAYKYPVPEVDKFNFFNFEEYKKIRIEMHKPLKEIIKILKQKTI